ncbi:hypothetical protein MAR_027432 [Mya arenaria]|uniref:Uncharacterized protein n=1 Tax=Mya arenaria TaxID=6604 RepID=A0ABY7ETG5_MYAAR|nr:hypothetical protein MAR_027432 [Mya arenaria]
MKSFSIRSFIDNTEVKIPDKITIANATVSEESIIPPTNQNDSWGSNGWSNSISKGGNNPDPEGQHNPFCIAGSGGWGRNGWGSSYYDESCSWCRHDRSAGSFGNNNKAKGVFKLQAVVDGVKLAKKSLWD